MPRPQAEQQLPVAKMARVSVHYYAVLQMLPFPGKETWSCRRSMFCSSNSGFLTLPSKGKRAFDT